MIKEAIQPTCTILDESKPFLAMKDIEDALKIDRCPKAVAAGTAKAA